MENFEKNIDIIPGKGINLENVSAQSILNEMCCSICSCMAWDVVDCNQCGTMYCMNCNFLYLQDIPNLLKIFLINY